MLFSSDSVPALTGALLLSITATATADLLPGYAVGEGDATSRFSIDFEESGGDAYTFVYRYDSATAPTTAEALAEIDAAGGLDVFTTEFSFGTALDGFAFDGNAEAPGFDAVTGRFWEYFVQGGSQLLFGATEPAPVADAALTAASVGISDRFLADGSIDGFVVNVSAFVEGVTPTDRVPAGPLPAAEVPAIPEPATAGLLAAGGLVLLRRRVV